MAGAHVQLIHPAGQYTTREIELALTIAFVLGSAKLVLCIPPARRHLKEGTD